MVVNRVARAKQFLPFDALKGLQEALREKEIEYEDKKELSEETLTELNNKFNQIERGSCVKIKYYKNGRYSVLEGIVTNINCVKKKIQIDGVNTINICDIANIFLFDKILL